MLNYILQPVVFNGFIHVTEPQTGTSPHVGGAMKYVTLYSCIADSVSW